MLLWAHLLRMCHTCMFEVFLELETGLTTFTMEMFDLLMFSLPTGKLAMQYRSLQPTIEQIVSCSGASSGQNQCRLFARGT